jgi:hypothetical protein
MPVKLTELSDRQWTQVRAALMLWRQLAENSRQHPSSHPSVAEMFKQHGPLNLSEIDELLEGTPEAAWLTPQKLANSFGVDKTTVLRYIRKHGIEPDWVIARTNVYRADKLVPVVQDMETNGHG